MTTNVENTIEYYKELLLYQYINQPNARAHAGLLVSQAIADLIPKSVNDAFDIETATGVQLDVIGEYIDFDRVITSVVTRDYFALDDYTDANPAPIGFTDYTNDALNSNGTFFSYSSLNTSTFALNDSEYRTLLKLKSVLNISHNSLYEINDLLNVFFGTDIILSDQRDMSLTYLIKESIARIIGIAKTENLLPKPMGVLLSAVVSVSDPTKVWQLADYTFDYGNSSAFSDYLLTAPDTIFIDYGDAI